MPSSISSLPDCITISERVTWSDYQYAILDSPGDIRFFAVAPSGSQLFQPEEYPSGVLFGRSAELRWRRRRGGRFHLVRISDTSDAWPDSKSAELVEIEQEPHEIVLWGELDAGSDPLTWYEPRIPRPIAYPFSDPARRLAVRIKHYRMEERVPVHEGNGKVVWKAAPLTIPRCSGLTSMLEKQP